MLSNSFVARVIFCEASPICSTYERLCVASVIKNRVNHLGFKKPSTLEEVVLQPHQFSCINDPHNSNWRIPEDQLLKDPSTTLCWRECLELSTGDFVPVKDITMYHDKSIVKPASWDNRWWTSFLMLVTPHFKFYSLQSVSGTNP